MQAYTNEYKKLVFMHNLREQNSFFRFHLQIKKKRAKKMNAQLSSKHAKVEMEIICSILHEHLVKLKFSD